MGTKHTPGPWSVESEDGRKFITGEGRQLAKILVTHANNDEYSAHVVRAKANANLIAAAPELLYAIKRLASYADALGGDLDEGSAIQQAYAAIAKATGEAA